MPKHPVTQKLENDILPYIVTARRLNKQWFYITYLLFGYTTDILIALTAMGVIQPVYSEFFAINRGGQTGNTTSISNLTVALPSNLYYPILLLVLIWAILRVAYIREEGQNKAVLAKGSQRVIKGVEAKLPRILGNPNPMPEIIELYRESLIPTVDRCIQDGAWPWTPFALDIEIEVQSKLDELCRKYEPQWQIIVDEEAQND